MRLLIRLRSIENSRYDMQYHYHLQSYIYSLLKDSKYEYIHDKQGYKFFCLSNIFPACDLKKDDCRTLIISSPDDEFIQCLFGKLNEQSDIEVNVGSMKFRVAEIKKISPRIPTDSKFTLITGTPIIIRIRKQEFNEKLKIISLPAKPEDWMGKTWASQEGYMNSAGDILLFTDADSLFESSHTIELTVRQMLLAKLSS